MPVDGEAERESRPVPRRRRGEVGGGVCRFGMGIEILGGAAVVVRGGAVVARVSLMGVWWWAFLLLVVVVLGGGCGWVVGGEVGVGCWRWVGFGDGVPEGRCEGRCWCKGTEKSSGEKEESEEMEGEKVISQLSSPDPAGPSSSGLWLFMVWRRDGL